MTCKYAWLVHIKPCVNLYTIFFYSFEKSKMMTDELEHFCAYVKYLTYNLMKKGPFLRLKLDGLGAYFDQY